MGSFCKFCRKPFRKNYPRHIFCSLLCANRFNLNNKNKVLLPRAYSKNLAELFGILLGDGSVTKYYVKIYLNRIVDAKYAPFVVKLCQKLFPGASVTIRKRIKKGTIEIQISSKDVSNYLIKIGFNPLLRNIPLWITANISYIKAVLRGLFDTEGSMGIKYYKGKNGKYFYKQLTFTNKNKNLLSFVEQKLENLKFSPTKNSSKNIYISNKKDIKRYDDTIGSHNPKLIKRLEAIKIKEFIWKGAPNW